MRVGLNLLYLLPGQVGGTQTYAQELIGALASLDAGLELVAYVNHESRELRLGDAVRVVHCDVAGTSRPRRYLFEQTRLAGLAAADGVDVLHSLGYVGPVRTPMAHVITVHDVVHRGFGEHMSLTKRLGLGTVLVVAARRADMVITDSESSRRSLLDELRLDADRLVVVPLAARSDLDPSSGRGPDVPRPYVLAFGSTVPSKNLPRLVRAFSRSGAAATHHLVLVGRLPDDDELDAVARHEGVSGRVVRTGWVTDAALGTLLSGAELFAFPSTYEGFGMPVLDAQILGVPVVCSNAASLPEVAGDAALLFDPRSVDDMADSMRRVLSDGTLRDRLVVAGRRNAASHSWTTVALRTLDVYRAALEHHGGSR